MNATELSRVIESVSKDRSINDLVQRDATGCYRV